ncbi:MAG: DUF4189 domain-containing protein [Methylobacteriaceae bacterium]|nr:DUF4189 domain-containing protein [Methylobacteriaceae bacterium]MBV9222022.1 DUF4189 domain-containing protein [Methylobacteriaceae bacterium]MBV9246492.1 DUF4189 domain-containing protein [Methylobacteriaceae bacterium]
MRRANLIGLCLVLAAAAHSRPAVAAFAIAFDPATGHAAAFNGTFDLEQAKRTALSNCGGGCRVVAAGKKTCAAVVESISSGGSVWAVGQGTTAGVAASNGWHSCRRKGGVICTAAAAICD